MIEPTEITVMTWNILASRATEHQAIFKNLPPNLEVTPSGSKEVSKKQRESKEQQTARHEKISGYINNKGADVVLLQEVDFNFYIHFKSKYWADYEMLFDVFMSSEFDVDENLGNFGVGIIFKKSTFDAKITYKYLRTPDGKRYTRKNALLLYLTHKATSKPIVFASFHLAGSHGHDRSGADNLLSDVIEETISYENVIIGGDFNCDFKTNPQCSLIVPKEKFISNDDNIITTCTFDYVNPGEDTKAVIDKIYATNTFTIKSYEIKNIDCDWMQIWTKSGKDVYYPSDHFPILAKLKINDIGLFISSPSESKSDEIINHAGGSAFKSTSLSKNEIIYDIKKVINLIINK